MSKIIHYCWFGGNPLPKLAKKCIASWKKYLPDYEIKEWSENNSDINACPFVKEAYEKKKWAFVADYVRTKAIYEYGGIYFDTDMLVKKPIDFLLDKGTFLGVEDSMMVNAAVWGAKDPKSYLAKRLLDFYESQDHLDDQDMYKISIPRLINKILTEFDFDPTSEKIQKLNNDIYIYPRQFFYPLSFDYRNNKFTEETCMIHYFEATWLPHNDIIETKYIRRFGEKKAKIIMKILRTTKRFIRRAIKLFLYPVILYRRYRNKISKKYKTRLNKTIKEINEKKREYLMFYNPEWLGVANATTDLFSNYISTGELLRKKDIEKVGKAILKNDVKQVIFSAMCIGWKDLAIFLKRQNSNMKIKVFWHGSISQVSEPYGWERNIEIIELNKSGIIDLIGTCKESLVEFYQNLGCKVCFIGNTVNFIEQISENKVKIGIYAAKSDDWRKNMFAQIAAVSLIPNAIADIVPKNPEAEKFAKTLGLEVSGVNRPLSRGELLARMSKNTLNLYVTFSECAPMLPIESFEMDVPCISGNNHHYFKNDELENFVIVNNEENPESIAKSIENCLKNKDYIMNLYKKWKIKNDLLSKESINKFLEI